MPLFPEQDILERAARVLVEFTLIPGRANFRLLCMDADMASVKRKAVESFKARRLTGAAWRRTFPL